MEIVALCYEVYPDYAIVDFLYAKKYIVIFINTQFDLYYSFSSHRLLLKR